MLPSFALVARQDVTGHAVRLVGTAPRTGAPTTRLGRTATRKAPRPPPLVGDVVLLVTVTGPLATPPVALALVRMRVIAGSSTDARAPRASSRTPNVAGDVASVSLRQGTTSSASWSPSPLGTTKGPPWDTPIGRPGKVARGKKNRRNHGCCSHYTEHAKSYAGRAGTRAPALAKYQPGSSCLRSYWSSRRSNFQSGRTSRNWKRNRCREYSWNACSHR